MSSWPEDVFEDVFHAVLPDGRADRQTRRRLAALHLERLLENLHDKQRGERAFRDCADMLDFIGFMAEELRR